jgi:hypothetical protein
MDRNRPPHLPKKRPAVTIDGEAAPVETETEVTETGRAAPEMETAPAASLEAETAQRPSEPEPEPAPAAGPEPVKPPVADEPPVAASTAVPPVARATRGGSITSGLIGAVLALGGGFGLQTLGYLPAPDGSIQRIAALEARLQALGAQDAGDAEGEIAALKESIAALTAAGTPVADLAARIATVETQLAQAAPATDGTVDPALLERLAALEARVQSGGDASGGLEQLSAETKAGIAALNAEIAALEDQLAARAGDPNLAAAVAATALRAAVDRGGPFAGELETLAAFQPGSPAVDALRAFAATGVPPRTEIIAGFEDAAAIMLAADAPVKPDATLMERLMEGARGLVRVRPVGDVEGDTTGARIARIGEALTRSDDAAVEAEFAALAAPVRAAGEPFMQRFRARAEADRLIAEAVRAAAGSGS